MTPLALALVGLVLLGFPSAWLASRSVPLGALLAPLAASVICSAAAMSSLATRTPLLPWVGVWLVVATTLCWWRPLLTDLPLSVGQLAVVAAIVAPLLLLYRLAPGEWDARSIWWFHAEWFSSGGARAAASFSNPAFSFSHPDYPPLAPATIATNWLAFGTGPQLRLAQATTMLLTYSALVTLGVSLTWTVRVAGARLRYVVAGVGGVLALASASFAIAGVADGYVDHLWSAWLVAGALLLLLHPPQRSATILATVLLTAAVLTKNEAFAAATIVIVLATIRHRHRLHDIWLAWVAVGVGVVWQGLSRVLGARSDVLEGGNAGKLLRGDHVVLARAGPTVSRLWVMFGRFTLVVAAISVLGMVVTRSSRRRRHVGSDLWIWSLLGANVGVLILTYVISPYPIDWHLEYSVDRTTVELGMILLSLVAVALVLALDRRKSPVERGDSDVADRDEVHSSP